MIYHLMKEAQRLGITVNHVDKDSLGGAKGRYYIGQKRIDICKDMSLDQTSKTLAHKLCHALLHDTDTSNLVERDMMEVEAESTAFVMCQYFGADSSSYSFGYVASWAQSDAKRVIEAAANVNKAVTELMQGAEELPQAAAA